MAEKFTGKVEVQNSNSHTSIVLDGESGEVSLQVPSANRSEKSVTLNPGAASVSAGGKTHNGRLYLKHQGGKASVRVTADNNGKPSEMILGGSQSYGQLVLKDRASQKRVVIKAEQPPASGINISSVGSRIRMNGGSGSVGLGGSGKDGKLRLRNKQNKLTVVLDAQKQQLHMNTSTGKQRVRLEGNEGNLWLGGNNADGDLVLFSKSGDNESLENATIHLNGEKSQLTLKADGKRRAYLDGSAGNLWLGGNGVDGDLLLFADGGDNKTRDESTIHLDGNAGDIILRNADCAEDFDIQHPEQAEAGTVLVIGSEGKLHRCERAYDKRVAGVVSGAGSLKPGIVLGRNPGKPKRKPIALTGKVYCKVDASHGPIEVGDLLTTSPTPGHAMCVTDSKHAFGTVLGKALEPIDNGTGLIQILVALQ